MPASQIVICQPDEGTVDLRYAAKCSDCGAACKQTHHHDKERCYFSQRTLCNSCRDEINTEAMRVFWLYPDA